MEENSSISLERWESLNIRYQSKYFFTDDYQRDYLILHNESKKSIDVKLLKFKYSKISLDGLVKRMEEVPQVPREYIQDVKDYYSDKKDVSLIPLHLKEIRDNLMDANLLIEYVKERGVDWEFISRETYEKFNPKQKKFLKKRNRLETSLENMSELSLKAELQSLTFEAERLEKIVQESIQRIKDHDRTKQQTQ